MDDFLSYLQSIEPKHQYSVEGKSTAPDEYDLWTYKRYFKRWEEERIKQMKFNSLLDNWYIYTDDDTYDYVISNGEYGWLDELAFKYKGYAYDDITFSLVGCPPTDRYINVDEDYKSSKSKNVYIKLDFMPSFLSDETRLKTVKELFKERPVDIEIGNYYESYKLIRS